MFEREQSRFPEIMPEVKNIKIAEINKEKETNMKDINNPRAKIEELMRENNNCDRKIRDKTGKEEVAQKFIMPCQKSDCKDFYPCV